MEELEEIQIITYSIQIRPEIKSNRHKVYKTLSRAIKSAEKILKNYTGVLKIIEHIPYKIDGVYCATHNMSIMSNLCIIDNIMYPTDVLIYDSALEEIFLNKHNEDQNDLAIDI